MYRIILVDDEPLALSALQAIVPWQELGFSICALCTDTGQACQALLTHHPDAVITDIRMADGSGMDLIKTARISGLQTEFIILSAYRNFDVARQAIDHQVFSYLLKPVSPDELKKNLIALSARLSSRKPAGGPAYDMDIPSLSAHPDLSVFLKKAAAYGKCFTFISESHALKSEAFSNLRITPLTVRQFPITLLISSASALLPDIPTVGLSRQHTDFSDLHQMLEESSCSLYGNFFYAENDFVSTLQYYIGKNYGADISLASLCQTFFVSSSYICNTFKKYTQSTITDFILHVRISHARRLLENGAHDTAMIAELVGFHNYSYFCRTFKKITGSTPLSYRRHTDL